MEENTGLGVGLHLNLTVGKPICSDLKTIVDEDGNFLSKQAYKDHADDIDVKEIEKEYQAQIAQFIKLTGHLPTHIDHHHSYRLVPKQVFAIKALADYYHLPMRGGAQLFKDNYDFERVIISNDPKTTFYGDTVHIDFFLKENDYLFINEMMEMMCHPGFNSEELEKISAYNTQREVELSILTDTRLMEWLNDRHIELINYQDIKKNKLIESIGLKEFGYKS